MELRINGLGLALLLGSVVAGCMTEPITGRRQLNFMPTAEENALGLQSFTQMKKEVPIDPDPAANALVQKVGRRIAAVANLPNAQWEFVVFASKEANAFCLPGGKVGVYSGILPITRDEAGLATVIGHEVGHALARHGGERMSEAVVLQGVGAALTTELANNDPRKQAAAATAYGFGSQLLVSLPHSRTQESSADHIGLVLMARAGYPPSAAVQFWQRFAQYNRGAGPGTPWFLRDHPVDEQRIKQLQQWLPEAEANYHAQN